MISHKTRLILVFVIALVAISILAAQKWLQIEPDVVKMLREIVGYAFALVAGAGALDALFVERRRRDPNVPAIVDDVGPDGQPKGPRT